MDMMYIFCHGSLQHLLLLVVLVTIAVSGSMSKDL